MPDPSSHQSSKAPKPLLSRISSCSSEKSLTSWTTMSMTREYQKRTGLESHNSIRTYTSKQKSTSKRSIPTSLKNLPTSLKTNANSSWRISSRPVVCASLHPKKTRKDWSNWLRIQLVAWVRWEMGLNNQVGEVWEDLRVSHSKEILNHNSQSSQSRQPPRSPSSRRSEIESSRQ